VWLLCGSSTLSAEDSYTENACQMAFSVSTEKLKSNREEDYHFDYESSNCCCTEKILSLFAERTKEENKRVNPATDTMLKTLGEYEKDIRYKIKSIENLKQINALYSMPQRMVLAPTPKNDYNTSEGGCIPLDFSSEEDKAIYLSVIDKMENRGLGAGAYSLQGERSTAFGRYQIMPSTAQSYCKRTPASWNCCTVWKDSVKCQDEMFRLLTLDNTRYLSNKGIPLNTCTVYIAHQQGSGGLYWVFGGKSPYSSIKTLREVVHANVSSSVWKDAVDRGVDTYSEEGLRTIYLDYWNNKFHTNILESSGTKMSVEMFQEQSDSFVNYANEQKLLWREGILLELRKIIHRYRGEN